MELCQVLGQGLAEEFLMIKCLQQLDSPFPRQVATNSLAANVGLKANDFLNSIAGQEVFNMTHDEVREVSDDDLIKIVMID